MRTAPKKPRGTQAVIHGHAVRAMVQILLTTGRSYTLETLRGKLRECFLEEGNYEKRAFASLSSVQLVTALLEASPTLAVVGLQLRLVNGVVQLATLRVETASSRPLSRNTESASPHLTLPALEVLACIAFKQPITQSEIDRRFGGIDKRHLVFVLREMGMVKDFGGSDGRLRFATTEKFLRHFGLQNLRDLQTAYAEAKSLQNQSTFGFLP